MHRKDVREPVSQLCVTAGNCTMAGRGFDPPSSHRQGGCRTSVAPAWVGFAQRFRKIHLAMAAESIDTNCMTLTRYWLHWNEIANVFVNKWQPHILTIQLFNLIYVLPSFWRAWTLLFLENHSNRLRFILAEQKKHAKGGTGERVKPIYYKVETTLFFWEIQFRRRPKWLRRRADRFIRMQAWSHYNLFSTQVGFRKQVQGTWSIVLVDGASVIAFSSTVTHPQRSTNGTPGRRISDQ